MQNLNFVLESMIYKKCLATHSNWFSLSFIHGQNTKDAKSYLIEITVAIDNKTNDGK